MSAAVRQQSIPVGFRMALAHPDRINALIVHLRGGVQGIVLISLILGSNAGASLGPASLQEIESPWTIRSFIERYRLTERRRPAHNDGLGANWKTRRAFWVDRAANESAPRTNLLSLQTTRTRHVGNDPNVERYDPDLWTDEFNFLNQPGQADIQSDLFYDYRTNVESYPKWQAWMRERKPRLLVLWGKYDLSFEPSEPEAYRRDVSTAEVHVLDAGHFALDTAADQIAQLVRTFMR